MKQTTKILLAAALAVPLMAWADIDTPEKRFAMSRMYYPHAGLGDPFGRFAMSGMYYPVEDAPPVGVADQKLLLLGVGS